MKTSEQTEEMKLNWGKDYTDYLDYVTGWHATTLNFYRHNSHQGEWAFVTTNSITQGQPVRALFVPLYWEGWRIKFAHRTFAWDSEAPGKAAVHCVIVGFTKDRTGKPRLFDYAEVHDNPEEVPVKTAINAYLVDGPNVLVEKRMKPLADLGKATRGSQPTDSGNLIVEQEDYATFAADPVASKYLRPFRMGKELIHGLDRWCLWLEDLNPADLAKSELLKSRVEACRNYREAAPRKGDAYKLRETPHISFDQIKTVHWSII